MVVGVGGEKKSIEDMFRRSCDHFVLQRSLLRHKMSAIIYNR